MLFRQLFEPTASAFHRNFVQERGADTVPAEDPESVTLLRSE